jgi:hypothetical protein
MKLPKTGKLSKLIKTEEWKKFSFMRFYYDIRFVMYKSLAVLVL